MENKSEEQPIEVYAFVHTDKWYLYIPVTGITMEGDRTEDEQLRHEVQSLLEILVLLRSFDKAYYKIYINSTYCRDLCDKWIARWVEQRFRIPNKETLRPNHDLIVKLYSFQMCMKFELCRQYDDFDYYNKVISIVTEQEEDLLPIQELV